MTIFLRSKRTWIWTLVIAISIGVAAASVTISQGTEDPPLPDVPPLPTPQATNPTPRPDLTFEEAMEIRRAEEREGIARGDRIIKVSGPETAGKLLVIAGKDVQLPPDAYVLALITDSLCIAGRPCPETPSYVIKRGLSTIVIAIHSGTVDKEEVDPNDEGAFDFLKGVLP
jgi:hypothetical protein